MLTTKEINELWNAFIAGFTPEPNTSGGNENEIGFKKSVAGVALYYWCVCGREVEDEKSLDFKSNMDSAINRFQPISRKSLQNAWRKLKIDSNNNDREIEIVVVGSDNTNIKREKLNRINFVIQLLKKEENYRALKLAKSYKEVSVDNWS